MNAYRIDIFHVAHSDRCIICIPHYLVFDFFKAFNAFFNQYLMNGGKGKRIFRNFKKLLLVIGKTASGSSQCKCRPEHDRITDFVCGFFCLLDAFCNFRRQNGFAKLDTQLLEFFSVFRFFNAFKARAEQFDLTFLQDSFFIQLHRKIKAGLSADSGKNGVRSLVTENFGDIFKRERLHIYFIGNGSIRHNRSGVRIRKYDFISLFL